MIPRLLVERELAGLLLSPEQVNAAMGAAGMTVTNTQTSMSDNSATMAPQECLAIDGAAEAPGLCQQRLLGRARSEPHRRRSLHALPQAGSGVISSRRRSWRLLRCV